MPRAIPSALLTLTVLFWAGALVAQDLAPSWSNLGGYGINAGLAGPIGDGVTTVAFSSDGLTLYTRTARGDQWVSSDRGERWKPFASPLAALSLLRLDSEPSAEPPPQEPDAIVIRHPYRSGRLYALGRDLYLSADGGAAWIALTSGDADPIVGLDQADIAFDPSDPEIIFVANSAGLWRSADGGLSWIGLNDRLPNFPAVSLGPAEVGAPPTLISSRLGVSQLFRAGAGIWLRVSPGLTATLPAADRLRSAENPVGLPSGYRASYRIWLEQYALSGDLTACAQGCDDSAGHYISAAAASGSGLPTLWAGTSDGRVWISADGGLSWHRTLSGLPNADQGLAVRALWTDPSNPRSALAVFSGPSGGRVFRTVNGGAFWDDLSADLPAGELRAIAASGSSGAVYIAGDQGVFYSASDLRNPAPPSAWQEVSGDLPAASIEDLYLDTVAGRLYAAVRGYGVFEVRAPEALTRLRLLNAADLSERPTAPGGLITVQGATLQAATVGGFPAPVLASDDFESQIQTPFLARSGEVRLSTAAGVRELSVPFAPVSPTIFVADGEPLALDAATGRVITLSHPARPGSRLLFFAAGLGAVDPPWLAGIPAPLTRPPKAVATVTAQLNGVAIEVVSATLAGGHIGSYMVEVQLPTFLQGGVAEFTIAADGQVSNAVRLLVQP